MKRFLFLALSLLLFSSCEKDGEMVDSQDCHIKMKEQFKDELKCSSNGQGESVHLFKGVYKGKTVYYPLTVCTNCNTMPPQFGYTCSMEKVEFEDFNENMKEQTKVYDSCNKKFSE